MEACPARFEASTEDEVLKHVELHASMAHNEDPASWPPEEVAKLKSLIRRV
jgi:predicted small metal-binding protein